MKVVERIAVHRQELLQHHGIMARGDDNQYMPPKIQYTCDMVTVTCISVINIDNTKTWLVQFTVIRETAAT